MNDPRAKKPNLLDLWVSHQFDPSSIAFHAHVPESTVDAMMSSQPVQIEDAEKVLVSLSERYNENYTLNTVHVVIKKTVANKSDVARIMQEIDAAYESTMRGMCGFSSGTAQHQFITKRMEIMAQYFIDLGANLGDDAAMQAMTEWQNQEADRTRTESTHT